MVRLGSYRGTDQLPGVRVPQAQVSSAIGDNLQRAGNQIARAGFEQAERLQKKQQELDNFKMQSGLLDFSAAQNQRMLDAQQNMQPGAEGFTPEYMKGFREDSEKFINSLPESVRNDARLRVQSLGNKFLDSASRTELKERWSFYETETDRQKESLLASLQQNPDAFEDVLTNGQALEDANGLPPAMKDQRNRAFKRSVALAIGNEMSPADLQKYLKARNVGAGLGVVEAGSGYTVIKNADGSVVKRTGSRNWRNNNPGNIEYGNFAKSHGAIGTDGRFAVFPDYQTGRQAKASLIFDSSSYRNKTIAGVISRYAPSFENDTNAYTNAVASAVGVSSSTKVRDLSERQKSAMLDAMERVEGFREGSTEVLRQGEAQPQQQANLDPQIQDLFSSLTYDDLTKLEKGAVSQIANEQTADNDAIRLEIEKDPTSVTEDDILSSNISDADKASRLSQLRTGLARVQTEQQAALWGMSSAKANPLDPDDRKRAETFYSARVQSGIEPRAAGESIAEAKGIIPKSYTNYVLNGVNSRSANDASNAAWLAYRLQQNFPQAVAGAEGGSKLSDAAASYDYFKNQLGLDDAEIGRKFVEMNDPEAQQRAETILKAPATKEEMKGVDAGFVESQISEGSGRVFDYTLGRNDIAADAMTARYKTMLETALVDANGDWDHAVTITNSRFNRIYGPSEFSPDGGSVVIPYPPEKTYPATPDGSHDYIGQQLDEAMKAEIGEYDEAYLIPLGTQTEKAAKAGLKVPYLVQYVKDGKEITYPYPFYADYQAGLEAYQNDPERNPVAYVDQVKRPNFKVPSDQPEGAPMLGAEQGRRMQSRDEEMRQATEAYRGQ